MSDPAALQQRLVATTFDQLSGWADDDHFAALHAFARTAPNLINGRYNPKSLGINPAAFVDLANLAISVVDRENGDRKSARRFFEDGFTPCYLPGELNSHSDGHVTGYYEPVVRASKQQEAAFSAPIYARPADLIDVDDQNRPDDWDTGTAFGRFTQSGLQLYADRKAIESGELHGLGLELAWVRDKVEAFFIQVQGSARLQFSSGEEMRITYAAKSGYPYTSIGKFLLEQGELSADDCGMDALRRWFANNLNRVDEILNKNRSFIFFKPATASRSIDGPVGAAKVPLTAGRSLAVDKSIHTFGVPIFVDVQTPVADKLWQKLMTTQDTGSAILGLARGDLYIGSGDDAGRIAGDVNYPARFHLFLPKSAMR